MSSKHHEEYVRIPGIMTLNDRGIWNVLQEPYLVRVTETYVGASNPKWKTVIEARKNATNALEATKSFLSIRPHHVNGYFQSVDDKWYPGGIAGWYGGLVTEYTSQPHLGGALDNARVDFLQKVSEEISPFKGMVFLAELKETAGMIHGAAKALLTDIGSYVKKASAFLRQKRNRTRRGLAHVNNMYLEYTYGWKPLVNDIGAFCSALQSDRERPVYIRGKGYDETATSQNFITGGFIGRDLKWSDARRVQTRAKIVGVLNKSLTTSRLEDFSTRFGLQLSEFVPTLWELIPYSFVADYFINIGDVLSSSFVETTNVAWYSATQKTVGTIVVRLIDTQQGVPFQSVVANFESGELRRGVKHLSRSVPTLSVSLDFLLTVSYPDIGSRRYLNMASLLLQKLK